MLKPAYASSTTKAATTSRHPHPSAVFAVPLMPWASFAAFFSSNGSSNQSYSCRFFAKT